MIEFRGWPKISRYTKPMKGVITEKMDGTNSALIIQEGELVGCQSRKRLIKPGDDNHGFACWAFENKERLEKLGDGYHYGEWCGPGINGNRHNLDRKSLFLFSWYRDDRENHIANDLQFVRVLHEGDITGDVITQAMETLADTVEYSAEGIVIYYYDSKYFQKHTFENPEGKWKLDE